ncbi:hypothetical protein XENOCAPTIV_019799 [Xenoophorus captivus]|uniref:Uncharacterized protein n=1 Tax=Xenoophorus captivus TaxID=1517983 RepID=A0ABV0SB25_9TELE
MDTVCPWHGLAVGDVVLYVKRDVHVDVGRWSDTDEAGELLCELKVEEVPSVELNAGLSVVSMRPETTTDARSDWVDKAAAEVVVVVRTLYKDGKYCMNHLFSRTQAIITDLLACRPSELIASPMGTGFFPWSHGTKGRILTHEPCKLLSKCQVDSSYGSCLKITGVLPFSHHHPIHEDEKSLGYIEGEITLTLIYGSSILEIYQRVKREQEVKKTKTLKSMGLSVSHSLAIRLLLRLMNPRLRGSRLKSLVSQYSTLP